MQSDVYEIVESSGGRAGEVIGYMKFWGAEPVYLAVEQKALADVDHDALAEDCDVWMDLDTWRAWTCRTLTTLHLRRYEP